MENVYLRTNLSLCYSNKNFVTLIINLGTNYMKTGKFFVNKLSTNQILAAVKKCSIVKFTN